MIRPFNPASPTISARSGKEIQASRNWKNSFCSTINSEISPAFNEFFLQKDFQPLISPLFLLNINSYSLLENGAIVCKKIESLPFFKQGLLLDSLTKNAIITSKVKNGQVIL